MRISPSINPNAAHSNNETTSPIKADDSNPPPEQAALVKVDEMANKIRRMISLEIVIPSKVLVSLPRHRSSEIMAKAEDADLSIIKHPTKMETLILQVGEYSLRKGITGDIASVVSGTIRIVASAI